MIGTCYLALSIFFFSSRRRHTRFDCDWSSDVCSSDLVLRQAPDVILIGEIRDMETLDTALKAADTGHLVFSTLHTTDCTQTISRVISFFPPHQHDEIRHLLSTALQAVVSLPLVPRKDGRGRTPACEVLINTAGSARKIPHPLQRLHIPEPAPHGSAP